MNIERIDAFLPVINLSEDVEKIALLKAALKAFTKEHERVLLSVQRRLKAGRRQIDLCTHESNTIIMKINAVEAKITESVLFNQEAEAETLNTIKENRSLKRKIISLKQDMEQQEKMLKRANETMNAVRTSSIEAASSKKNKECPDFSI